MGLSNAFVHKRSHGTTSGAPAGDGDLRVEPKEGGLGSAGSHQDASATASSLAGSLNSKHVNQLRSGGTEAPGRGNPAGGSASGPGHPHRTRLAPRLSGGRPDCDGDQDPERYLPPSGREDHQDQAASSSARAARL